jgi:hypothetical protein
MTTDVAAAEFRFKLSMATKRKIDSGSSMYLAEAPAGRLTASLRSAS